MRTISIIALLLLISCQSESSNSAAAKSFKEIDYTFDDGWKNVFSMKIDSTGSCLVGEGRWNVDYYSARLTSKNLETLDSTLQKTPLLQYGSAYRDSLVDQASYKIVLIRGNRDTLTRYVYGRIAPKPLNDFSAQLQQTKKELKLAKKDTLVEFASRKDFFPPPIKLQ